jgi:ribosomal protein S18 acetylase RimI-like enzyme
MRWVNLKKEPEYLFQYMALRNKYRASLLTDTVTIAGTKTWIENRKIEAFGFLQRKKLVGVVILYLKKKGEIAFFVGQQNRGIGTRLLTRIVDLARRKRLPYVWAWVLKDNKRAQHVFKKTGFVQFRKAVRKYRGKQRQGLIFKRSFTERKKNEKKEN